MSSQAISQVGSQIGPLLKQFVKQLGPQAASALKGIGKFATNNPELTNQLLATGIAAAAGAAGGSAASGAATGVASGSTKGAQGALQALTQIDPDVLQNIINSFYSQNRDKKCRDCETLRKKRKSGTTLTDAEKRLEEEACRACEDFCAALDKNPQLGKLELCDALKALN